MPSVCLYFHAHQPVRLRNFSFFDIDKGLGYEDEAMNSAEFAQSVRYFCIPLNRAILKMLKRYGGGLRVCVSLSGMFLESLERSPSGLDSFRRLADSGMAEFMGEDHYRSYAFLFSEDEFISQVNIHKKKLKSLLGVEPASFLNTCPIYSNGMARALESQGCRALVNMVPLDGAEPGRFYRPEGCRSLNFVQSMAPLAGPGLFNGSPAGNKFFAIPFDYRVMGPGRIEALCDLINISLREKGLRFASPGELFCREAPFLNYPGEMPRAAQPGAPFGGEMANYMQNDALHRLYELKNQVARRRRPALKEAWRRLQVADHFTGMGTGYGAFQGDGEKGPYNSPYEAYISYMNILADLSKSSARSCRWRKKQTAITSM